MELYLGLIVASLLLLVFTYLTIQKNLLALSLLGVLFLLLAGGLFSGSVYLTEGEQEIQDTSVINQTTITTTPIKSNSGVVDGLATIFLMLGFLCLAEVYMFSKD
jgi:hypothetical protein